MFVINGELNTDHDNAPAKAVVLLFSLIKELLIIAALIKFLW